MLLRGPSFRLHSLGNDNQIAHARKKNGLAQGGNLVGADRAVHRIVVDAIRDKLLLLLLLDAILDQLEYLRVACNMSYVPVKRMSNFCWWCFLWEPTSESTPTSAAFYVHQEPPVSQIHCAKRMNAMNSNLQSPITQKWALKAKLFVGCHSCTLTRLWLKAPAAARKDILQASRERESPPEKKHAKLKYRLCRRDHLLPWL